MQQRKVILVLGQTGSGKSFLANQIQKLHSRVLVGTAGFTEDFDVTHFSDFDALLDYFDSIDAWETARPFRVGYDFLPEEYDLFFATLKRLKNVLGVSEEADRFVLSELPAYQDVIYRGRHHGIPLLSLSLSPKDLPTDFRRQVTDLISFRQIFPDDLDWLSKIVGEAAYDLPQLSGPPSKPPHPYLYWNAVSGARIVKPGEVSPILTSGKPLALPPPKKDP